jgi:hypothetical protein
MATDKQIAANRTNALRSSGPKTAAGKSKASRNAYRHGLSRPIPIGPASAKIDAIVRELVGKTASEDRLTLASDLVHARVELLRIRSIRTGQLQSTVLNDFTAKQLQRLAALDRYERYAHTKRRRASKKLSCEG